MKLTKVQNKITNLIHSSINYECYIDTYVSTSSNIFKKIDNEIGTPNIDSISIMQKRTLNNLQNEIN